MNNPGLIKNFTASGAIAPCRIVKIGADCVAQASAATDAMVGVSERLGAADGERIDIVLSGIAEVDAGGSITVGDRLTADSDGKAVTASAATASLADGAWPTIDDGALTGGTWPTATITAGSRIIGIALESASSGERVSVLIDRA